MIEKASNIQQQSEIYQLPSPYMKLTSFAIMMFNKTRDRKYSKSQSFVAHLKVVNSMEKWI